MFHFSSYAWSNAYTELCERWVQLLAACISHQVDFLQATEICSLSETLKRDDYSDFRSCIPVGLLERFLSQINMHRSALNRITFNIVSSTQAGEHIKAQQGDQNADCDSRILISICYGKQTIVCEERGQQNSANVDGWVGSAFDTEIFPNDLEQPKHLLAYDLGLGDTEQAFHSPLMATASMRAMENMRIRSQAAESWRRGRWQDKNAGFL